MLWFPRFYTTGCRQYEWRHKISHANHTSCILLILYYDSKVQLFQKCINTCNRAMNCHISIGCLALPDSQLVKTSVSGFTFTFVSIRFRNTRRLVKTRITCAFVYICEITITLYRLLNTNTFSILQVCLHLFIYTNSAYNLCMYSVR